jgi:hypothetical protein
MKTTKALLAAAVLFSFGMAAIAPASAAVVDNLGINPTSRTGDFSSGNLGINGTGSGAFTDQVLFQLVGGPQFLTITSATNVFPNSTDFITNFQGAVYQQVGALGGADDILRFGPELAQACILQPSCQVLAGAGILEAGSYYLQLTGIGGGTSGYGGNLAVTAVPIPGALLLFGSGLVGLGLLGKNKLKKNVAA